MRLGLSLLAAVPLAFLLSPAHAACANWPVGSVQTEYVFPLVTYDMQHSYKDLNSIEDDGIETQSQGGTIVGLAVSRTTAGVPYKVQMLTNTRTGRTCARVAQLKLRFGFEQNVVYVARELAPYDCIRKDVLTHEYRHVMTNYSILQDYAPGLLYKMKAAVAQLRYVEASSQAEAQSKIEASLNAALDSAMKEIRTETKRRQAMIDTKEEYMRTSLACDGILQQLIRKD